MLVPHSGAGLYAAALAARLPVRAVVHVDAALPDPGADTTPVAPAALVAAARALAVDGVAAPWSRWWEEDDVARLFADPAQRRVVEAEQRAVPLAYLDDVVPVPRRRPEVRCAYLAFGETYAAEHARAAASGWPTARLDGAHLHQLVAPDAVAEAVLGLLTALEDDQPGAPAGGSGASVPRPER